MGPTPDLATYQAAAEAQYAPQLAADQATAAAGHQANLNTLSAEQATINPEYDQALTTLQTQLTGETGALNQKYTEALGGNFSGLQGNDLGMLYSQANQDVTSIQTQRANALNDVATKIANENLTYTAGQSALTSKYQGLESGAASSAYDTAVNQYNSDTLKEETLANTENYQAAELGLRAESIGNTAASKYTVSQLSSGNKAYKGPNGQTNLYQYAQGVNGGAGANPDSVLATIQQELSTGSTTDKGAAVGITKLQNQGLSTSAIIARLAQSNAYIFQ